MPTLKQAISRLREFHHRVRHPHDFYATHREQWRELAARITRNTVLAMRPPDEMAETWALKAETLGSRVTATLLSLPEAGCIIALSDAPPGTAPTDPRYYSDRGIAVRDLIRWIQAGRTGNPEGKHLDERDDLQSDAQIAWRILYAIRRGGPTIPRLLAAVHQFLGGNPQETGPIAGQILRAWLDTLVPVVRMDYEAWLSRRVRAL